MSEDDAEARGKRAVELRKQIADLIKRERRAPGDDTAPPGVPEAEPPALGRVPAEGTNSEGVDAPGTATPSRGPDEKIRSSEEDGAKRRNAPSVYPPSPRDFIARRMRELDRSRDDDHE